jgi:hypothetical protein
MNHEEIEAWNDCDSEGQRQFNKPTALELVRQLKASELGLEAS